MNNVLSVEETSIKMGCSVGYVRELCRVGLINKEDGLVAMKVGREWKIPVEEINRKLGIKTDKDTFKKELYIKDLESKVARYELVILSFTSTLNNLIGTI